LVTLCVTNLVAFNRNLGLSVHHKDCPVAKVKTVFHKRRIAQTMVALAVSCLLGMPNVSLGADEAEEGFVSLFDGKTLDVWSLMNGAKFVVEDGVIKHNEGNGWLRSDKQYADFILRLEFRFLKPKQDGGVFLRAGMEGKDWPDQKYEVQIENTRRMAKIFNAKNDHNIDLTQKVLKPLGEWNEYEITVIGPRIEVRLNGELVSTTSSATMLKRGYLGFQGENGAHEYRNLRLKELSK
jgi:hypothetical protein